MSNLRQAAQQALEALEWGSGTYDRRNAAITALKQALAEPEQEPVACPDGKPCKHGAWCTETYCQEHCEFRAPPQRKPLTDEEIAAIASTPCAVVGSYVHTFARAIERAHGIGEQA